MPTIQDHISLDALTEGTLSTLKAIGVDDIAIRRWAEILHMIDTSLPRTPGSISA